MESRTQVNLLDCWPEGYQAATSLGTLSEEHSGMGVTLHGDQQPRPLLPACLAPESLPKGTSLQPGTKVAP